MKRFLFSSLLVSSIAIAQTDSLTVEKRLSTFDQSCTCISEIDRNTTREEQFAEVRSCLESAIMAKQLLEKFTGVLSKVKDTLDKSVVGEIKETKKVKDTVNIVLNTAEGYDELERELIDDCGAMNSLLNDTAKVSSEKSVTQDPKAMDAYDKAMDFYRAEDYDNALKYYKKAVKIDKEFAFAWDMVGITYRKLEQYKNAVKAYKKSLKLDPRGKMPLQNLPIAYRMLEQYEKAADYYRELIRYYPRDPEGYYGLGQCGVLLKDDDMALDNMMQAYIIYQDQDSPYVNDAATMLSTLFQDLKKRNKENLFMEYAAKHDLNVAE